MGRPIAVTLLCASLIPAISLGDMFRPSVKDQIALGKRAADQVRKESSVLPDSDPRVRLLRSMGKALVELIPKEERDKKPFEYQFDVIESREINAFALPGGPVFFYTGLFAGLETEDQVMGVLAHEIIHVRKEHWASAYENNQKRQLGVTLALILLKANKTVFDVASVSDTLLFTLPYSRKHETESDTIGYGMLVAAGYNPQGMADVFKFLKANGGGSGTAEWMSTHPDSDRRIANIEKRIAQELKKFSDQRPLGAPILSLNASSAKPQIPVLP